ncbi:hypothetical protein [Yersinia aldovae]|uniref:hypothetical protein n=1 Tax=Yersinia aldovae TaxID=29483 RepID=UPI0011A5263A|nr:hypothetical protein [Yersinia aldovae]EKN4745493.1 hypothetical protein [Yersinia enterocolitica]
MEKNTNWFVRILIVLFSLALSFMIGFKYFYLEPKGQLNGYIIFILCVMVILILAESFDNFSLGKYLTISREVKQKEREVEKLERINSTLFQQVINMTNIQSQSQSNTNVYGNYQVNPYVGKANEDEIIESKSMEGNIDNKTIPSTDESRAISYSTRRKVIEEIENISLNNFYKKNRIHESDVVRNAKLVSEFHGVDPISTMQMVFDGYIKSTEKEIFIEVKVFSSTIPIMFRDRLYLMLSKINHYKNAKNIEACLELIIIVISDDEDNFRNIDHKKRLIETFSPAIDSGLLTIHYSKYAKDKFERSLTKAITTQDT